MLEQTLTLLERNSAATSSAVNLSVALSGVAKNDVAAHKTIPAPVFRALSWQSDVIVTMGRPTIIFISDNVSDTGKTELELTATEIKQP